MNNDYLTQANCRTHRRVALLWLAALAIALLTAAPLSAANQSVSMNEVEAAVLKEDWKQVAELLKDVTDDPEKSPDPVLRLIKGHACLALNRNNESVCLFLSIATPDSVKKCQAWADDLVKAHSEIAIAYYLKGDAAARQGRCDVAIAAYNKALQMSPKHALLHNARGVAFTQNRESEKARTDFQEAIDGSNRTLADAYANVGAYRIQTQEAARAAFEAFDAALRLSPDFALAIHGRGCVGLVLNKEEAVTDLNAAIQKCSCETLRQMILRNTAKCVAKARGADVNEVLVEMQALGTTFHASFLHNRIDTNTPGGGTHRDRSFGFSAGGGGHVALPLKLGPLGTIELHVGGVAIDPSQISWDEGDWPFDETYALMYPGTRNL